MSVPPTAIAYNVGSARTTAPTSMDEFSAGAAPQLRDLGGAGEPDPGRRQRDLDRAAGAAAMALAHRGRGGDAGQGNSLSCRYSVGMLPLTVIT